MTDFLYIATLAAPWLLWLYVATCRESREWDRLRKEGEHE